MKTIIDKQYLLEKFPGKGGWTYARIPEMKQDKKNPFGWVKVKGFIDHHEIAQYKLMPMGNGELFLPVKAAIRKIIGKKAGDYIHVTLYPDNDPIMIPEEFWICLKDEPMAHECFMLLKEGEQKKYIDWIYAAKKESIRIERIAKTIAAVSNGLTLTKLKLNPLT